MKYVEEVDINLPIDRVIELFDNAENLKQWQPGLVSFEPLSGTAGEVGAKSKLVYQMGKNNCELIETITVKNLPDEFSGTYETKGMWNTVTNRFVAVNESSTKWICESEFKGQSLMMKLMMFFAPGMFKKETCKMLKNFEAFAEKAG